MKSGLFAFLAAVGIAVSGEARAARIVKGPWFQRVTSTSAEVRVEVDPPGPVSVDVSVAFADAEPATSRRTVRHVERRDVRSLHSVEITDLEADRRYTVLVDASGASASGTLATAPSDDAVRPFHFIVYGDNRTDAAAHASVVRAIGGVAADLLVHTGDFVELGGASADWQTFFDVERPLLRERSIVSCVGNHELVDGAGIQWVRYFGPRSRGVDGGSDSPVSLDDLAGTVRWGSARFFLLNGMVEYRAGVTRTWLEKALADADAEPGLIWRVVVVHHGPWSSGPHGNNTRLHEARIPELLRTHGVDVVLSGHDHVYERGLEGDLPYVVSGGGGAPLYRVRTKLPSTRKVESVHHFVDVEVTRSALRFSAIRPDGSVIERCGLTKGSGWDCDGASDVGERGGGRGESNAMHGEQAVATGRTAERSTSSDERGDDTGRRSRCSCRVVGRSPDRASPECIPISMVVVAFFVRRRSRAIIEQCVRSSRARRARLAEHVFRPARWRR